MDVGHEVRRPEQAGARLSCEVPSVALAIFAHPDDPDVSCGGTLAFWAQSGTEVHVCLCCLGDKGSTDPSTSPDALAELRRLEVQRAGQQLGVTAHHWLGYPDGHVPGDLEVPERLVSLLRALRPEVVVAPDPTAVLFGPNYVNHRDHRAVGWAVLDAVSPAAANPHYFPQAGPPHQVKALYLAGTLEPDTWVDITGTLDLKAAALACHQSQLGPGGEWLRNAVGQQAQAAGDLAGVAYAEAFRKVVLA